MSRVCCNHCKATFYTKQEYNNRPACMEPLCPLLPKNTEVEPETNVIQIDRVKVRQVIDEALAKAAEAKEEKSRDHAPVNLHSMPPPSHDPYCLCTVCFEKRREQRIQPVVVKPTEQAEPARVAARPPQAKIHVRSDEEAVPSKIATDGGENVYVEAPKAVFVHIRPRKKR